MDTDQLVAEYLDLTAQIKTLTDKRSLIGAKLPEGRHFGVEKDIRVVFSSSSSIDMFELRRWVMPDVIDRCRRTRNYRKVAVVEKLKPKKEKK